MADIFDTLDEKKGDVFDVVAEEKDIFDTLDAEPSLGRVGAGLVTEVGIGEGTKLAGATIGAVLGGPVGAAIGYGVGALAGGIAGSLTAQEIEGQDDVSWGRVTADTALNLIPGGLGKAAKGAGILPRLAKEGAKRAIGGSVISTTGAQIEKGVEEGELLTVDELKSAAFVGAGLGIGFGAAGELLKKAYPKFGGKSGDFLNDAYEKGDPDATQVVETLAGENPVGRGSRLKRMIFERVAPSVLVGRNATADIIRSKNESEAAVDLASSIRKKLDGLSEGASDIERKQLDDYVTNKSQQMPGRFQGIKDELDDARLKIDEYQNRLMELYRNGEIDMDPRIAAKIQDSIDSKDYFTREYRLYEDSTYVPSEAARNKLIQSLVKKGQTVREASEFSQKVIDARDNPLQLSNLIYRNKGALSRKDVGPSKRQLKQRQDLTEEMREFLGEYTETGERLFGTISRLGRMVAYEEGNRRVARSLISSGVAQKFAPNEVPEGYKALTLSGKVMQDTDGQTIYIPQDSDRALNELYGTGMMKDKEGFISRMADGVVSTAVAGSKFAAVPLNLAAYPVQLFSNAFLTAGQGFNPFRGWSKRNGGVHVAINEALPERFKGAINKALPERVKVAINQAIPERLKVGKISLKELTRLKELGIVDKGVTASDIRDGFKNGIAPKFFQRAVNRVGKAYNTFDTAQRIAVYENYKKLLNDIIPDEDIARMGQREFEDLAGQLTNDTYMNYDRINKGIRKLSRYGFLNEFIAFNSELARTTFNQGRLARSMRNGDFAKQLEEKYGVAMSRETIDKIKREGLKRYAGLTAVLSAGVTVPMIMNREGGISSEQEQALRETALADWEADQSLHLRRNGNKITAANLSYQMPTAEMTSILEAGFRGEGFMPSFGKMADAMWSKYGGQLPIGVRNAVAAANNLNPRTGRPISERTDDDSLNKKLDLVRWYLGESFTPGTVKDFRKMDERETMDNILRYTLGYRVRNLDIMEGAGFKLRDIKKNLNSIRSAYTGDSIRKEDIGRSYEKYNNLYRGNVSEAIRHVNNLRVLGISDSDIEKKLRESGLTKVMSKDAMSGVVRDMPLSARVSIADRGAKRDRYVELSQKLPRESALRMLQEDFDKGNLKRADIQHIIRRLELEQLK
jgi:hypothetical protein